MGLTQAELGVRIGLTFEVASTRINRYEKGQHAPDLDTAERLAEELGVPLAYFVARDPALAQAILGFAGLSKQRQARVLKAIRSEAEAQGASAPSKPKGKRMVEEGREIAAKPGRRPREVAQKTP